MYFYSSVELERTPSFAIINTFHIRSASKLLLG
jgi:hypothetical protein